MGPPRDVRSSFDGAVEAYDRVRPSYATELFDEIEAFVGDAFGGRVTRPLVATLTTATLRPVPDGSGRATSGTGP